MDRDQLRRSALDADTSFLLARASAISTSAGNAALRAFDLKVRSYSVLALAVADGPSQRDLSDFLRLDPSQVVALVDGLESRGLVERRPDPRDRRAKVVVATGSGRVMFEAARAATLEAEHAAHGMLSSAESDTLRGLLRRIAYAD